MPTMRKSSRSLMEFRVCVPLLSEPLGASSSSLNFEIRIPTYPSFGRRGGKHQAEVIDHSEATSPRNIHLAVNCFVTVQRNPRRWRAMASWQTPKSVPNMLANGSVSSSKRCLRISLPPALPPRLESASQNWSRKSEKSQVQRNWSGRRDSNPRPSAWEADALPLSYARSRRIILPQAPLRLIHCGNCRILVPARNPGWGEGWTS